MTNRVPPFRQPGKRRISASASLDLSSILLLMLLTAGSQAADGITGPVPTVTEVTAVTTPVKGRAPQVTSVVITNQTSPGTTPIIGHVLQADYSFSDADSDAENGTLFYWMRGSQYNVSNSRSYTTQIEDAGQNLTVSVTPVTDSATTDPSRPVGTGVVSAAVTVEFPPTVGIGNFLPPDTLRRDWSTANSYCQSLGARLPSQSELQDLFINTTSATVADGSQTNYELCSKSGWPLSTGTKGYCGGSGRDYWSSTAGGSGRHFRVGLSSGFAYSDRDRFSMHVACTR